MLNKPIGMRFIIADTTALLHMGRGISPYAIEHMGRGILSYLCRLEGGLCPGGFCPFPVAVVQ